MRTEAQVPRTWRALPLLGLWIAAGVVLSELTKRARDWFDMTDELRYERLAISIARTHSLVPRIHGVDVQSFAQLYPLLIAPIFAHGLVPQDLIAAHELNAWVMTSACVPAYLLTRSVVGKRSWAYLVAALSVVMPWIVYSTMLMTEVAAYPAFVWALYAIQVAIARPSPRHDLLALLGLGLAFLGRTELLVLVFVPPVAILALETGQTGAASWGDRARRGLVSSLTRHPVLGAAYALLVVGGVVAYIEGRLAGVFGVYGVYAENNSVLPAGELGSFATHVALFALGVGLVPFLVGASWAISTMVRPSVDRARQAFACIAATTLVGVFVQATNFDVRYTGFVHDRFLIYLVPVVLIGMACALDSPRLPRYSLAAVVAVVAVGFATGSFPAFTWQQFPTLNSDSPMSGLLRQVVSITHTLGRARVALTLATILLGVAFLLGAKLLPRRRTLVLATILVPVLAMPSLAAATFTHLFDTPGWSLRPLTLSEANSYDWIDQNVSHDQNVTVIPSPVSSDYFASQQRWRDLEFYNATITRDAIDPGGDTYAYTGLWFPKIDLAFNPQTGRANVSPTLWAAESANETRFALDGEVTQSGTDVLLIKTHQPWQAAWLSFGLYDDGWTRPRTTAHVRIYAYPGQTKPHLRTFSFVAQGATGAPHQPITIVGQHHRWTADLDDGSTASGSIILCVPPHGYAQLTIDAPTQAAIPGDQATQQASLQPRQGGVEFPELALAGEIGPTCTANDR